MQQLPEMRLEKEVSLSLGGGLFNLIDLVDSTEVNLSKIDHLRLAVYKVLPQDHNIAFDDLVFDLALLGKGDVLTWERIVRVRKDGEQVWIYAGMDLARGRLQELSIFVFERDELVLINVDGDLQQLLDYAMEPAEGRRGVYTSG